MNLTATGLGVCGSVVGLSYSCSIMLDSQNPSGCLNYNRHVNVSSTVTNAADVCRSLKLKWQCISSDDKVHVY
jgi:hypothetical protein